MNILDENVIEDQRELLRARRIRVRHVGYDIVRKEIKDDEIIPLLHRLRRPTFFTHDAAFFDGRCCHPGYCLVYLHVDKDEAAEYIFRVLRHPLLDTQAKRTDLAVRVSSADIRLLRRHGEEEALRWPESAR